MGEMKSSAVLMERTHTAQIRVFWLSLGVPLGVEGEAFAILNLI